MMWLTSNFDLSRDLSQGRGKEQGRDPFHTGIKNALNLNLLGLEVTKLRPT